jgi:hypothetical protein
VALRRWSSGRGRYGVEFIAYDITNRRFLWGHIIDIYRSKKGSRRVRFRSDGDIRGRLMTSFQEFLGS